MSAFYNVDQPPFNMSSAARAISATNNGLLFDIGDMSTLYQDTAGAVPVTAVGQPVGLVLDKSQGLEFGPELVTNGDFNLNVDGWSATTPALVAWQDGELLLTNTFNGAQEQANYVLTPYVSQNKIYEVSVRARRGTASAFSLIVDGNSVSERYLPNLSNTEMQTYSFMFLHRAGQTSCTFRIRAVGTGTVYLDDVSIKEVLGNHATQPITASRPTLIYENGMYGLKFDGVDDYLNLPYMGLYAGGAASIVCAVDSVAQVTDGHLLSERSTESANQKYILSRRLANDGIDSLITNNANTIVKDTNGTTSELHTKTVRSIIDNGQNINIYKEGVLSGYDDYTRSGVLTLNTTTIGASVSTTTTNFMNFKLFGLIITKSALNDTQRLQCEKYLGRKVNVPI